MHRYTERVTVLVDKKTLKQIKSSSKKQKMPLSEWLRMVVEKELG